MRDCIVGIIRIGIRLIEYLWCLRGSILSNVQTMIIYEHNLFYPDIFDDGNKSNIGNAVAANVAMIGEEQ